MSVVRMINSVDEHVAGESYEVVDELADRFIILGYADGELSRDYTDEEREAMHATVQRVTL